MLQAAGRTADVEPTGHAMRMDALHLIREAAEFADVLERDAQRASAAQLAPHGGGDPPPPAGDAAARGRGRALPPGERAPARRDLNAARNEARQLLADANRDASQELREAEARSARLLEQSRHQATELTNAARAEVEQTLEWARGQAGTIMTRAQQGAEQLLAAAGLGEPAISRVVEALLAQAEREAEGDGAAAPPAGLRAAPEPADTSGSSPAS